MLQSGVCMSGPASRFARACAGIMLIGTLAAGCTATTGPAPILASAAAPRGTVAFDSIEGLPEGQFRKLVQALSQEAEQRQVAVVSRTENAQYRVRGYAAASISGKRTVVSWVWDVYDAARQRTTRLQGEERAGNSQRGWGAADDALIDRIAKNGMAQLASFLGNPDAGPPSTPAPAESAGSAIAGAAAEPGPELALQSGASGKVHTALAAAQR